MIRVGIVGGAGYVAGELLRCLLHHSEIKIDFIYSTSQAGEKVFTVHNDLVGQTELTFSEKLNKAVNIVFLCLGHGNSKKFLEENTFSDQTKIVDMSTDFRLKENASGFVYGLVELNKEKIKIAKKVANPGCFATAIQLGLIPFAKNKLLNSDVHVNAITGSTGAGQSLSKTTHFSWRNNNVSVYNPFIHRHLNEINETIYSLQNSFNEEIIFIPTRGAFSRGIFCTLYTKSDLSASELITLYEDYYKDDPFTLISNQPVSLKQVVNTNNCIIQVQKIADKVLITSVLDNLLKGAAGQAIQNMNIMFGLKETMGLKFKATYF